MPQSETAPRNLSLSVALVAAAMLLVEILTTRIFSVLFFYHYSFFAISLIMSGLALGGLLAARWNVGSMPDELFRTRLAVCAFVFAGGTLAAMVGVVGLPHVYSSQRSSFAAVVFQAVIFLPGLAAAGAFLAAAFARNTRWIGRLYAFDLVAAAFGCLFAIALMRAVPGPSALLIPALLGGLAGLLLGPPVRRHRLVGRILCFAALGLLVLNSSSGWRLLKLKPETAGAIYEQWNEHSRILVYEGKYEHGVSQEILIDKAASTIIPSFVREPGQPIPVEPWWNAGETYLGYRLGRPLDNVAIIGVGGGLDVLGALASGARHVDGYELNKIIVNYHKQVLPQNRSIGSWPEVDLIHAEARAAIAHAGKKYNVIQASMIDTWAATASGGFVLSENGIYTLDGWRTLLAALADDGVLTMTRWYLQKAETYRLVALATQALKDMGIEDPRRHIILAGPNKWMIATIIVSKTGFSDSELEALVSKRTSENLNFLAVPTFEVNEPVIRDLLDPMTRDIAIAESPYDLSVPTDMRPYFFLLLRPGDVFSKTAQRDDGVEEIIFNGVRVLVIMGGLSLLFAAVVFVLGALWLPPSTAANKGVQRRMGVYFLCIGLGYIFVQLGLHQRLILVLGHPTLALSVVLFSMLLGTGLGSAASEKFFKPGGFLKAWIIILCTLGVVIAVFPAIGFIGSMDSSAARLLFSGSLVGATGFVLGFGFPLGVRLAAPGGEWTVQRMWAINGAASIAGSALSAIIGVAFGGLANLIVALIAYAIALVVGRSVEQLQQNAPNVPARRPGKAKQA